MSGRHNHRNQQAEANATNRTPHQPSRQICKFFLDHCKNGDRCLFEHDHAKKKLTQDLNTERKRRTHAEQAQLESSRQLELVRENLRTCERDAAFERKRLLADLTTLKTQAEQAQLESSRQLELVRESLRTCEQNAALEQERLLADLTTLKTQAQTAVRTKEQALKTSKQNVAQLTTLMKAKEQALKDKDDTILTLRKALESMQKNDIAEQLGQVKKALTKLAKPVVMSTVVRPVVSVSRRTRAAEPSPSIEARARYDCNLTGVGIRKNAFKESSKVLDLAFPIYKCIVHVYEHKSKSVPKNVNRAKRHLARAIADNLGKSKDKLPLHHAEEIAKILTQQTYEEAMQALNVIHDQPRKMSPQTKASKRPRQQAPNSTASPTRSHSSRDTSSSSTAAQLASEPYTPSQPSSDSDDNVERQQPKQQKLSITLKKKPNNHHHQPQYDGEDYYH